MYYLLTYDLVDNYLDRRAEFRDAHLALAQAAADRGELLLGGALADPYVAHGLVRQWEVRRWNVAAGRDAKA